MAADANGSQILLTLTDLTIQVLGLLWRSFIFLDALSSHPLFATLATASLLVFLYLPCHLIPLILSPIPISTFLLLAALLRLGSSPPPMLPAAFAGPADDADPEPTALSHKSSMGTMLEYTDNLSHLTFCGGPLEVIYEENEGEEESSGDCSKVWEKHADLGIRRLRSIPRAYNDSGSESDGGSLPGAEWWSLKEELRLQWEHDEEDGDDMIEIELEENLIEIDISGGPVIEYPLPE